MTTRLLTLLTITIVVAASAAADPKPVVLKLDSAEASRAEYDRAVVPFLKQHCVSCHGPKKAEKEINVLELEPDMKATPSAARWVMLLEKLVARTMPPKSRPRPTDESVQSVTAWIQAEMKRAGKHAAKRDTYANGNLIPHEVLFDPKNIPPFDSDARVRRLSPEIYAGFVKDFGSVKSVGQPFSPEGRTTFKDMGAPKVDEPTTAQLFSNALAIAESQTVHKIVGGVLTGGGSAKEFLALFDPKSPPTDAQMAAAIALQFNTVLKRSPTADESERFLRLMKKNTADAGRTLGVRYTLATVFLLPEAIFRLEVGDGKPDAKGRLRLAPREIAYSLSYALTDKRPDTELLKAAATGELDTDEGVAKQVRRMFDDPKSDKVRILRFFREYFGYEAALEVFKDSTGLIDHKGHDARALIEDTDALVKLILEKDENVLRELLTTNKSFVAYKSAAATKKQRIDALAKFEAEKAANPVKNKDKKFVPPGKSVFESYGLTDFPDVQPVELPADQRAGILTQPSWLTAQSTSFDNHAIHRGKWVRERLLGGVVPDIPITVDAQLPIAPEKTLRERMAVTRDAYCWKCHQLMNDVSYPFEQFDHFGRFRTAEAVLDIEATAKNKDPKGKPLGNVTRGAPLNATGLIAHVGDASLEGKVSNVVEYMHKLATSERVEQVFVRHVFRFWMGRNETPGDAASLQAAQKAYRDSKGSMKALITALLTSESFLYRVPSATKSN